MSNEHADDAPSELTSPFFETRSDQDKDDFCAPQIIPAPAVVRPKRHVGATRKDKGKTHHSRHGLLSRDVERALVRAGESLRNLRRQERKFRSVLKPQGDAAELIFDKWWSCYLRQLLIAKLEATAFVSADAKQGLSRLPVLHERAELTLIYPQDLDDDENFGQSIPNDLLQRLAIIQRYDGHYSREGNRLFALLLLMRDGGESTLVEILKTHLGINK